jgi:non-specific serine/threonine protein kinase
MSIAAAHVSASVSPTPGRTFGRYRLRRLLGKSEATMTWLADDAQAGTEVMLSLPRVAPAGAGALAAWMVAARRAARLDHPGLARVLACDMHEHWPYVAVDRRAGVTLDEWLAEHPRPTTDEAAFWMEEVLRALAFAHDAGVAHLDPQFHTCSSTSEARSR